ncbi:uncharacterized protein At5g41620-like [Oryza glaberrima]|uniref:uncharacterized protein At5g41620-like n=1 Tax=Oryza glaberrima TaxID=4538 RepID=UPI00224C161E|nr:uncharacterized protein At5g41620-like [Oryza glaberrima]XP_052145082.1 uncharacterized protein At5g41620-like [Oryza glaberrima]XP_052145083.1 uncharacterized protein At5g41620-like [Oryza glaberrima]XP_052145084.1 uncharacterized protein At5g41620-like [Oryza glaberrima]
MLRRGAVVVDRDGEVVVATKIRKRCALSSSGASDPLRKLRLKKRGVVVLGRRGVGGGGGVVLSPWSSRKMSESSWNGRRCHGGAAAAAADDGTRSAASARKLVGALRQLSSPDDEDAARRSSAHRRCVSVEFSKRSRTRSKASEADGQRSWHNGHGHWFPDMLSNGSTMEVHAWRSQDCASPCRGGETMAPHLKEVCSSLATSKELVKALAGIWGPGDGALNPSTASSLLSALRAELDLARAHARRLAKEDRRRGDEAARARARLAEDAREWGRRQREKAAAAVRVAAAELDGERRSRRRAERVNAKLGRALADAERELAASRRELERERRSRERLEKVCDELVRGGLVAAAGGGRGGEEEVEEMRREAERAQEELEKEREMLRLADELREERVQMKLLEARLQFEEKNAVVEQLRDELEAFLGSKKDRQQQEEPPPLDADDHHRRRPDGHQFQSILVAVNKNGDHEDDNDGDEEDDGGGRGECVAEDSDGSEMHSIELNVDGNSKDYSWSYTTASKDMTTTARSKNAAAIDRRSQEGAGEEDRWDDGGCSERSKDLDEEDAERYEAIKNLREQMLAGHGFVLVSQEWGQC